MALPRLKRRRRRADDAVMTAPSGPAAGRGEGGFTIVEMVVAMTLLAVGMVAFAQMMYGGMGALMATRQRTVFVERATAEMESLRATAYDRTCVSSADPNTYSTFEGAAAVVTASCDVAAVSVVPSSSEATPHTIRRWITWTNTAGENVPEASATFKRLTVQLEWTEKNDTARRIRLSSVRYPGGFGPTGKAPGTNKPPVAMGVAIPQFGANPGEAIVFDGSASSDDVLPLNLTYSWNFGGGDVRTGVVVANKSYPAAGTYQVLLTVKDGGGLTHDRLIQVSVVLDDPANLAPTADLITYSCHGTSPKTDACDPMTAVAPLSLTFDATASNDPDPVPSNALYFLWDWGDGSTVEGGLTPVRSHEFLTARSYDVKVTAIDPYGKRATATRTVLARPLNCSITSGSLFNGSQSNEQNYIRVKGNNTPHTSTVTFTAKSNTACTDLKVRLPVASGSGQTVGTQLVFDGFSPTSDGVTVTWTASKVIPNNAAFHLLANQTAEFFPAQSTGTFNGTFTVAKTNTP
jgi:Tfp pilus assembly protein PilV